MRLAECCLADHGRKPQIVSSAPAGWNDGQPQPPWPARTHAPGEPGGVTGWPHAGHAAVTAWVESISRTVSSSSVEAIMAGEVAAGDVIVLPGARDAVLVKQVRGGAARDLDGRHTPAQDVAVYLTVGGLRRSRRGWPAG